MQAIGFYNNNSNHDKKKKTFIYLFVTREAMTYFKQYR